MQAAKYFKTGGYMEVSNLVKFETLYRQQLEQAVQQYPQEYVYGLDKVPEVFIRMMDAIRRGSFNKDSRAIKAVCKILGIKHTYTAIKDYLSQ